MCDECGCGNPDSVKAADGKAESHHGHKHTHDHGDVKILELGADVRARNDAIAAGTRNLLKNRGIMVVNLISSPGSGKTTLLEKTLMAMKNEIKFAVVEGDQQTDRDAERIRACGVPVVQINTISSCHLDAHQVAHAVEDLPLDGVKMLFIENVGNLVCPASFDLGEAMKVVLLSVTEGDDKPLKYPLAFHNAGAMVITKTDLLPYVDFDVMKCKSFAKRVNPALKIVESSCRGGDDLNEWFDFLRGLTD